MTEIIFPTGTGMMNKQCERRESCVMVRQLLNSWACLDLPNSIHSISRRLLPSLGYHNDASRHTARDLLDNSLRGEQVMRQFLFLLMAVFFMTGCASAPTTQAQLQGDPANRPDAVQETASDPSPPSSPIQKSRGAAHSCHGPKSRFK